MNSTYILPLCRDFVFYFEQKTIILYEFFVLGNSLNRSLLVARLKFKQTLVSFYTSKKLPFCPYVHFLSLFFSNFVSQGTSLSNVLISCLSVNFATPLHYYIQDIYVHSTTYNFYRGWKMLVKSYFMLIQPAFTCWKLAMEQGVKYFQN